LHNDKIYPPPERLFANNHPEKKFVTNKWLIIFIQKNKILKMGWVGCAGTKHGIKTDSQKRLTV